MHGKKSFKKTVQRARRDQANRTYNHRNYVEIGNWRLEEDPDGNLVIIQLDIKKTVILIKKD